MTDARLRMARVPAGADLIRNEISAAPGFRIGNVIVMAGVPSIMRVMLAAATPGLRRGVPIESRTIPVPHPEGEIAALLRAHAARYPDVVMGSYPQRTDGRLSTELVLRSSDTGRLEEAAATLAAALAERGLIADSGS
jgi:molybdopterin-biosynthesis enzyme MoeA-like protein